MGDSHLETTLAPTILSSPAQISYACPPGHITQAAQEYDSAVRNTLEAIVGGPTTNWSWQKATLPSSRGDLNLRSALLHAPACSFCGQYTTTRGAHP